MGRAGAAVTRFVTPVRLGLGGFGHEFGEQLPHAPVELIPDLADLVYGLAGWIFEFPVLVTLAGVDRAGVFAAHGDHHVRGFEELISEGFRERLMWLAVVRLRKLLFGLLITLLGLGLVLLWAVVAVPPRLIDTSQITDRAKRRHGPIPSSIDRATPAAGGTYDGVRPGIAKIGA